MPLEHAIHDDAAVGRGVLGDLARRRLERAPQDLHAGALVAAAVCASSASSAGHTRSSASPPPGTIPSATAALVELIASSSASFFDFISDSDGAPTRITATPPESLASRSSSFSRS